MKFHVIVVGSGGTGTYFLKEFSRFIAGGNSSIAKLTVIDGDTVEKKNLARQAFTEDDIGENKAVVMADVLNTAFDLKWESIGSYIVDIEQFRNIVAKSSDIVPLIVGCGDNHALRLLLEDYFNSVSNCIYLDSANEFSAGEVVFAYKIKDKVLSPCRSHYFPDIKNSDLKARTEMSCEELNSVAPQHIATNMQAGNILLQEVSSLMNEESHPGMVTFDIATYYQEFTPYQGNESA